MTRVGSQRHKKIYLCMLHEYHVICRYIGRSVISAVFRNRGRSWNVLPVVTVVHLCIYIYIYI